MCVCARVHVCVLPVCLFFPTQCFKKLVFFFFFNIKHLIFVTLKNWSFMYESGFLASLEKSEDLTSLALVSI